MINMKMVQFSEQFQMAYEKARSFLGNITTSSRLGVAPDRATLSFLRSTVTSSSRYTLYRGLSLSERPEGVVAGQPVPDQYKYPKDAQVCIHTTDDQGIAKKYASNGKFGLVYQITVQSDPHVMFDSAFVSRAFPDLNPELTVYLQTSHEVLLKKNAVFETRVLETIGF